MKFDTWTHLLAIQWVVNNAHALENDKSDSRKFSLEKRPCIVCAANKRLAFGAQTHKNVLRLNFFQVLNSVSDKSYKTTSRRSIVTRGVQLCDGNGCVAMITDHRGVRLGRSVDLRPVERPSWWLPFQRARLATVSRAVPINGHRIPRTLATPTHRRVSRTVLAHAPGKDGHASVHVRRIRANTTEDTAATM